MPQCTALPLLPFLLAVPLDLQKYVRTNRYAAASFPEGPLTGNRSAAARVAVKVGRDLGVLYDSTVTLDAIGQNGPYYTYKATVEQPGEAWQAWDVCEERVVHHGPTDTFLPMCHYGQSLCQPASRYVYAALVVRVHHRSAPEVSPQPQRFHLATNHIIPLLSPSYSAYLPRQQANRRALLLFYPSLAR